MTYDECHECVAEVSDTANSKYSLTSVPQKNRYKDIPEPGLQ